ncbi:MAG: DNA ligase D [Hyphomonadaceae bacterium]|nr:DNA ligase D [Hyphomonadaceae bacterium]
MPKLDTYKAKRRFGVTPEPEGAEPVGPGADPVFVIQKHAARRLHYDLRLEIGGALRSWAVPEGPCLDTKIRRLAVQTEDHPMEYGGFEGRIPSGEYGAGGVIVWDRGTYVTLEPDVEKALAKGELKFRLVGEKLRGGWTLVRLKEKDAPKDGKSSGKNWLFIKERDDEARPLAEYDVLKEAPDSVISGLSVEDLKQLVAPEAPKAIARPNPARIKGAVKAPMPKLVSPQLASTIEAPPEGEGWLHEIKYDGYRTIVRIETGPKSEREVKLFTRNQHDWTHRYRALAEAFAKLDATSAIIDGEAAVQDARGVTNIALLESALSESRGHDVTYFAFDLLYLDGYDLSAAKLIDRKRALAGLLAPLIAPNAHIQLSEHIQSDGAAFFAHANRMGLEGIISKRADAPYVQARTKSWVKVKRAYVGDFIVIGYTRSAAMPIAALIIAEEVDGVLTYVGRVTFNEAVAKEWPKQILAQPTLEASVAPIPKTAPKPNGVTIFTQPFAVARIAFNSRADDGAPRQPVLLGLQRYVKPQAQKKRKLVTDRDLAAIRLTNPEREMFEGSGVTKLDLAIYYARVGDWMLPELLRRPVSLIRCPTGALKDCFYQRHAFHGLPPGIGTIDLSDEEGRGAFIYVENAQGFLALSQFGAVEFHPWGCRIDDPEHPDRLVIDMDPDPTVAWPEVKSAAELLRARLQDLGFEPFLRTTGGKGLHLVMALTKSHDWAMLKGFAEAFARAAAKDAPNVFTASPVKEHRKRKIYLDYVRNARGASAVASYSLRANTDFTVAAPIAWEELRNLQSPREFDRKSVPQRLSRLGKDPWEELESSAAAISLKARRAVGLKG